MKTVWKKTAALVMVLMMIWSLAGCGSSGGGESSEKVKIGFVVSDMSDAFFAHLVQNMQADAEKKGVTLTVKECPEISDKITGIENFVEAGCTAIICHVTDADALKDAASNAESAGV